jgi:hypothetical protein
MIFTGTASLHFIVSGAGFRPILVRGWPPTAVDRHANPKTVSGNARIGMIEVEPGGSCWQSLIVSCASVARSKGPHRVLIAASNASARDAPSGVSSCLK